MTNNGIRAMTIPAILTLDVIKSLLDVESDEIINERNASCNVIFFIIVNIRARQK